MTHDDDFWDGVPEEDIPPSNIVSLFYYRQKKIQDEQKKAYEKRNAEYGKKKSKLDLAMEKYGSAKSNPNNSKKPS